MSAGRLRKTANRKEAATMQQNRTQPSVAPVQQQPSGMPQLNMDALRGGATP